MTTMLEKGTYRSIPRKVSQLTSFVTLESDLFVLAHLGIPLVSRDDWSLSVTGLARQSLRLRFGDLAEFTTHSVTAFHKCAGNPLKPAEPTPDRIGNVIWRGIRLRDVLLRSGYQPRVTHIWADGSDSGSFEGVSALKYQKDLPLAKALKDDVLLAYEMNGEPLSPHRGGPVRLVVPGWYGTNSVKWLQALHLADGRAEGPFTTTWYNDADASGARHPVWAVAPDSAISSPEHGARLSGPTIEISGWSWGEDEIARVDLSTDGGATWSPSELAPRTGKSWQAFTAKLRPARTGTLRIRSRATDVEGRIQPMAGARNASVTVEAQILV
jgi:DMSO/TMAO reductase YedYZ molybdopterin-dependent catalytic subunit